MDQHADPTSSSISHHGGRIIGRGDDRRPSEKRVCVDHRWKRECSGSRSRMAERLPPKSSTIASGWRGGRVRLSGAANGTRNVAAMRRCSMPCWTISSTSTQRLSALSCTTASDIVSGSIPIAIRRSVRTRRSTGSSRLAGASWERIRKLPAEFKSPNFDDADKEPPVQIDIYVGGKVRWSELLIPHGLKVIDERLEAHGFTSADKNVLEGKVFDLISKKPVAAALRLEPIESPPQGDTKVLRTLADRQGHWVMKQVPQGRYQLVADKEGYVPCFVDYPTIDGEFGWHQFSCGLAPASTLSGRVTDEAGKPVADVAVRLSDVMPAGSTGGYRLLNESLGKTAAEGRFQSDQVPAGKARIGLHKAGYILRGLGPQISIPAKDLVFKLERSAQIRVTVAFPGGERPPGYQVEIDAEGGRAVGQWGGSGDIDQQNQIVFSDMPPGRYILQGHPNPFTISRDKRSKPVTIDVKRGQSAEITLSAD